MDGSILAKDNNPYAYDAVTHGYGLMRRADPRFLRQIAKAVGGAASVLSVGAGTSAYEPPDRRVVAVELGDALIAKRGTGSAPVVKGAAEALPFRDGSFAAAMSVLTLEHWADPIAGLRELARVATRRAIVLTLDPSRINDFWLYRYIPDAAFLQSMRYPAIDAVREALGGESRVVPVPIPHDCQDNIIAAHWRRPSAYLERRVRARIATLAELGDDHILDDLRRLSEDLRSGAWDAMHGWMTNRSEMDLGYRLVVAEYSPPDPS